MKAVPSAPSIRAGYEQVGVDEFYRRHGATYRNPHEPALGAALGQAVACWRPDLGAVLDLACGSGEAAIALESLGAAPVTGCDPATGAAWQARMGRPCLPHAFADIAAGALAGTRWSLVVCSFALHLCPPSRLPGVLWALAGCTERLWIITPHKRPQLKPGWAFATMAELVHERVRVRDAQRQLAAIRP
jgi:SAM-dependent methyltransferase